jgi:hypothetical protein
VVGKNESTTDLAKLEWVIEAAAATEMGLTAGNLRAGKPMGSQAAPTAIAGTPNSGGRWAPPMPADDLANFYVYVDRVSTKSLGGVSYEYNVGAFDAGDRRTFGIVSVDRAGNQSEMSPLLVGVPHVVGLTLSQAEDAGAARPPRRDREAGSVGSVVTTQTPAAGSVAVKGTAVKVVLSGGPAIAPASFRVSASPAPVLCGAGGVVRLRVQLSDAATLRGRLLSGRRTVATAALGRHHAGSSGVNFKLPGRLGRGTYKLVLDADAGGRKAQTAVAVVSRSRGACGSR